MTVTNIAANAWPGYDPGNEQSSFVIPVFTDVLFLTNSTYSRALDAFLPLTGVFEVATPAFYVPHWWLNLRTRLRVALLDTSVAPMRILDYVNLDSSEPPLDITDTLMRDNPATYGQCGSMYTANGSDGSMWCTNHWPTLASENYPTYGILNQIGASLGVISANWNDSAPEFPAGLDKNGVIDFFRYQFGLAPLTYFTRSSIHPTSLTLPSNPLEISTCSPPGRPMTHWCTTPLATSRTCHAPTASRSRLRPQPCLISVRSIGAMNPGVEIQVDEAPRQHTISRSKTL